MLLESSIQSELCKFPSHLKNFKKSITEKKKDFYSNLTLTSFPCELIVNILRIPVFPFPKITGEDYNGNNSGKAQDSRGKVCMDFLVLLEL